MVRRRREAWFLGGLIFCDLDFTLAGLLFLISARRWEETRWESQNVNGPPVVVAINEIMYI